MRKNFYTIFFFALLISCQKEFNSPEQAENEVTKKGLKDGRWVEYILSERDLLSGRLEISNDTINNNIGYRLLEYENGFPIGQVREFYKSGATSNYKITIDEPARLDKFPKETILDTIITSINNKLIKILYHKDSIYSETIVYDSLIQKIKNKNISVFYRNIPKKRQNIINEIDFDFLKKFVPNVADSLNTPFLFYFKTNYDIIYTNEGKKDTIYNINLSKLDNELIEVNKIIAQGKVKIFGNKVKCSCCNKQFYEKQGSRYVGETDDSVKYLMRILFPKPYCSKKCAVLCGPYE